MQYADKERNKLARKQLDHINILTRQLIQKTER